MNIKQRVLILVLFFLTFYFFLRSSDIVINQENNEWYKSASDALSKRLSYSPNKNQAKNIILIISDGNGIGVNYASRVWKGQKKGGYGDDYVMSYEKFPHVGLVKTYTVNAMTPDSAGTMTAMMSGIKTRQGVIGLDQKVIRGSCDFGNRSKATSFAEIAKSKGKLVGIVTTTRITHATPAAVYAHSSERNYEDDSQKPANCDKDDIAIQLFNRLVDGDIDIALGGGRRHFFTNTLRDEEGTLGSRTDGRNLLKELQMKSIEYAWNLETLKEIDLSKRVLGLFDSSHLKFVSERMNSPSLKQMTISAHALLNKNKSGYFLMIEAGRVDHALHQGNINRAMEEQNELDEVIEWLANNINIKETLIIVAADHGHSMTFNGYCGRGTNILGYCMEIDDKGIENTGKPLVGLDGKPYEVVVFANGPGSVFKQSKINLVQNRNKKNFAKHLSWAGARRVDTYGDKFFENHLHRQEALVPMRKETHSGEDVAVYAVGPWSHLLSGTLEQNFIFHVMNHAIK